MEEKRKFKVGDRVRCIVAVDGNERVLNATGTVKGLRDYDALVEFDKNVNGHNGGYTYKGVCKAFRGWYCKFKSLELLSNETIVIYRKGNEVIALDKSTGKKAVAKCSPADEFNFNTGAKLAFERLTCNVTFRVLCLDNKLTFFNRGDIYEFVDGQTKWRDCTKSSHYKNFNDFISCNPLWRNKVVELKEGDDPAEILKKYDETIKVGDTVKVVDTEKTYDCYNHWTGLRGYESHFVDNKLPINGGQYRVLNVAKHDSRFNTIVLIQDTDTTQVFIVGIEGVKKC